MDGTSSDNSYISRNSLISEGGGASVSLTKLVGTTSDNSLISRISQISRGGRGAGGHMVLG